jgi:transposase
MTTRKIFTKEFKQEAVELSRRPEMTLSQAARDLGIGISTLQRWGKELYGQGDRAFPGNGRQNLTPDQQEIKRLRKENEILREEREILKKATAFFIKQSR